MAFEFSHLLEPLAAAPPVLARADTDVLVDLRAPFEGPAGPTATHAAPEADVTAMAEEASDDWLAALFADPVPPTADASSVSLLATIGLELDGTESPTVASWPPSDGLGTVIEVAPDPTAVEPEPVTDAPPRSRFATPSLDDDLLPIRAKRR